MYFSASYGRVFLRFLIALGALSSTVFCFTPGFCRCVPGSVGGSGRIVAATPNGVWKLALH